MTKTARQWADVFIENLDDRVRLQQKALFFIPSALEKCERHRITIAGLASTSSSQKRHGNPLPLAGKAVIQSVFRCKQPVAYDSIINFINLVNYELGDHDSISFDEVVACVFRLRDTEIVAELGISAADIQQECKLSIDVVHSALSRMRITYNDACAIWRYLSKVKKERRISSKGIDEVLTGKHEDFIRTDVRDNLPMAIQRIGKRSDEKAEYVYSRHNLTLAPKSGHPWAIAV